MDDYELCDAIRAMTSPGLPVTLHTIKAGVLTEDKSRVEPFVRGMVANGELAELPKGKFQKIQQ
ncbi:hypothetical protein [Corynebacterium sp. HMSC08A12]|uniref:hypothetical protein n=1 Tax=Corynebacterium sp. HMSC08A12 TaxID=1581134 RepID=UPI00143B8B00|nr:hypothetical protein [Corynebacterium sp. HMSC08A12]